MKKVSEQNIILVGDVVKLEAQLEQAIAACEAALTVTRALDAFMSKKSTTTAILEAAVACVEGE